MLPYILGAAGALALLGAGKLHRRKHHHGDPRTAQTRRLKIVSAGRAVTRRMARVNPEMHDRPLAAHPYISYRYSGRYGWVMIGAKDHADALREANRSLASGKATIDKLQIWNGSKYIDVKKVNPKRRNKKGKKSKHRMSPDAAASRLAWWRWHHNPGGLHKTSYRGFTYHILSLGAIPRQGPAYAVSVFRDGTFIKEFVVNSAARAQVHTKVKGWIDSYMVNRSNPRRKKRRK